MYEDEAYCFLAEECKIQPNVKLVLVINLANKQSPHDQDNVTKLFPAKFEFSTDNCAAHHVCNNRTIFIG